MSGDDDDRKAESKTPLLPMNDATKRLKLLSAIPIYSELFYEIHSNICPCPIQHPTPQDSIICERMRYNTAESVAGSIVMLRTRNIQLKKGPAGSTLMSMLEDLLKSTETKLSTDDEWLLKQLMEGLVNLRDNNDKFGMIE